MSHFHLVQKKIVPNFALSSNQKIPLSLDSTHTHNWAQNCHTEAVTKNCREEMVLGQQGGKNHFIIS